MWGGFSDSTYFLSKKNMNSVKILILLHLKCVIKSICSLVPLSSKGHSISKSITQKVTPPKISHIRPEGINTSHILEMRILSKWIPLPFTMSANSNHGRESLLETSHWAGEPILE